MANHWVWHVICMDTVIVSQLSDDTRQSLWTTDYSKPVGSFKWVQSWDMVCSLVRCSSATLMKAPRNWTGIDNFQLLSLPKTGWIVIVFSSMDILMKKSP